MSEYTEYRQAVIDTILGRLNAQELKGKARDRAALELTAGAAIATQHLPHAGLYSLSGLAFLVSVRGARALEEKVKQQETPT